MNRLRSKLPIVAFIVLALATANANYQNEQTTNEMCRVFAEQTEVFSRFVAAHAYTHGRLDPVVKKAAREELDKIRSADCK